MFGPRFDVVVAGSGPAGLAIATACAERGLRVACVAPQPRSPWEQSFGVWESELPLFGAPAATEGVWRHPVVWIDDASHVALSHAYARLDVPLLQARLLSACERHGVTLLTGKISAVAHHDHGSELSLAPGSVLGAAVVVDATGAGSKLTTRTGETRGRRPAPAFQSAYGELLELDDTVAMSLMDFRGMGADPPSFLYALPLGGGRCFVEETVLASRPAVSMAVLARRLSRRLARMGIRGNGVLAREQCVIPLGLPPPSSDQRVIAFGAAASLVHPATGYQIARAFELAPRVAEAIAKAPTPAEAAERAYAVTWPVTQRRAWELYTFGMEALCAFDLPLLRGFLSAFFRLPTETSHAFLRGTLSPFGIATAMAKVLVLSDPDVRKALLRMLPQQHQTLTRAWMPEEHA